MTVGLAELHVHLEGTVRRETALALAASHGLPPPPPYDYSTLTEFLEIYGFVCRGMVTAEDFERVILEHVQVMSAQGITYAEISFNPGLHPGEEWLAGVIEGRRRARADHGIDINWLVELVRGSAVQANEHALAIALTTDGVAGIGLVGDESIPARPLLPLVERALAAGLGFMPHAGQSGGPEVVLEAVATMHATRIAHGIAAAGDSHLLRLLADRGICLCVCPSSNARVGLRPDYATLARAGIPLTVNTDDPAMVPTTLVRELDVAGSQYGLDQTALIEAAWSNRFARAGETRS